MWMLGVARATHIFLLLFLLYNLKQIIFFLTFNNYSPDLMPLVPAFAKPPINLHLFIALDLTLCIYLEPTDHYIFNLKVLSIMIHN